MKRSEPENKCLKVQAKYESFYKAKDFCSKLYEKESGITKHSEKQLPLFYPTEPLVQLELP